MSYRAVVSGVNRLRYRRALLWYCGAFHIESLLHFILNRMSWMLYNGNIGMVRFLSSFDTGMNYSDYCISCGRGCISIVRVSVQGK